MGYGQDHSSDIELGGVNLAGPWLMGIQPRGFVFGPKQWPLSGSVGGVGGSYWAWVEDVELVGMGGFIGHGLGGNE